MALGGWLTSALQVNLGGERQPIASHGLLLTSVAVIKRERVYLVHTSRGLLHRGGDGIAAGAGGGWSQGSGSQEAESKRVSPMPVTCFSQCLRVPQPSQRVTAGDRVVQTLKPQWHQQMVPRVLLWMSPYPRLSS